MKYYQIVVRDHPGTERARVAQGFINANPDLANTSGTADQDEGSSVQGGEENEDGAQQPGDDQTGANPGGGR